ncbi:MAG: acyl-CoA thioesterase [Chloroflexales bacterium]|nr:acyl-CoA thioesterase [Chloroflexales bacterium]
MAGRSPLYQRFLNPLYLRGGVMVKVPAPLAVFPYVHWEEVHFRDLDLLGHANNVVYASWLESARIRYYLDLMDLPLEEMGLILAELTLTYKSPAYFGDRLGIGVRVGTIGSKSFMMDHVIAREGDEAVIATAKTVLVSYDYKLGSTVSVPEEFRRRVARQQE